MQGEDGDHQSWVWRTEFLHLKVEVEDGDLSQHHLALQGKDLCSSWGREFPLPPTEMASQSREAWRS